MTGTKPRRGWLLRLVIAFAFAQGAVSMARPAVSYRALALGADARAVGVIAGVYALLPLLAAVPLGRRTDHGRAAPLLPVGVVLIGGGCALSGRAGSLTEMALWSGVMGLGHLSFVIGAQSIVARRSAPDEQDRNFGHFTIGASLGQLIGPIAAGLLVSARDGQLARTSATALLVAALVAACSFVGLWRIEGRGPRGARPGGAGRGGRPAAARASVRGIMRSRGVPSGIFISLAVLSATDVLTAYLPVLGEHRGIAPATVGLLLSLRAAASIACRLVMTPMIRVLGRTVLMAASCLVAAVLCAGIAVPLPVWALAVVLALLGFALGVGQPLSMTTVVRAAPEGARSTALALRLTGNRIGQAAAPAGAGALAGVAGTAAPFVMLGLLLLGSAAVAARGLRAADADGGRARSRGAAPGAGGVAGGGPASAVGHRTSPRRGRKPPLGGVRAGRWGGAMW